MAGTPDRERRQKIAAVLSALRDLRIELAVLNHRVGTRVRLRDLDFDCLDVIARHGPISPSALAGRLGVHLATMTGVLDRLERGGWVTRDRAPGDRRAVVLASPPDRQREIYAEFDGMNTRMGRVLASYSSDQLDTIVDFLHQTAASGRASSDEIAGLQLRVMSQLPGDPYPLSDDDRELLAAQYADRPQLRPVLDAVLAAASPLGEVTVHVRRTIVTLVSPRRTFSVLQARTKQRLDMGLRLTGAEPHGRLLPARDLGASTVRIALATTADVDAETISWLRRAYEESVAPPPPRKRPAPRLPAERRPLVVRIEGFGLPGRSCRPEPGGSGYENVHVGIGDDRAGATGLPVPGRRGVATELVPGDAKSANWEVMVTIRRGEDAIDFGGPSVRGDRSDRHLGLIWGDVRDGVFRLFRGAKLRLVDVDRHVVEQAWQPGFALVARVRLTDACGNPICARVRPPDIEWSARRVG